VQSAIPSLQHWGLYLQFVFLLLFSLSLRLSCLCLGLSFSSLLFVSCLLPRLHFCICPLLSSAFQLREEDSIWVQKKHPDKPDVEAYCNRSASSYGVPEAGSPQCVFILPPPPFQHPSRNLHIHYVSSPYIHAVEEYLFKHGPEEGVSELGLLLKCFGSPPLMTLLNGRWSAFDALSTKEREASLKEFKGSFWEPKRKAFCALKVFHSAFFSKMTHLTSFIYAFVQGRDLLKGLYHHG
jgi:hypothetical protein